MTQPALHSTVSVDPAAGPLVRVVLLAEREAAARPLRRGLARAGLVVMAGPVAVSGAAAFEHAPDAVVLAADVTRSGGLAGLRRVRRELPVTPVVVVGARDDSRHAARAAVNAGASAYVAEQDPGPALAIVVRAVVAGFVCVPHAARGVVVKPSFSQREKEVLGLLVGGLTNAQIARRLYLAESTVKTHLASAFAKLGVRSRRDAVTLLLDPDEGLGPTALPLAAFADDGAAVAVVRR